MSAPQRKTFDTQVKVGKDRRIRFVISDGSVDRDDDTISPAGWDLTAYRKNPVVLWAHDRKALPVAKAVEITAGNGKLIAVAEFAKHPFAEDVFQLYSGGFLRATSVGFRPLEVERNNHGGTAYLRQELVEFSCVPVPANANALMAAAEAGLNTEALKAWALTVLGDDPQSQRVDNLTDAIVRGAQRGMERKYPSPGGAAGSDEVVLEFEETFDIDPRELALIIRTVTRSVLRSSMQDTVSKTIKRMRGQM